MKKSLICTLSLLLPLFLQAQFKVTFKLTGDANLAKDTTFITGSFNNWVYSTADDYELKPDDSKQNAVTLHLEAGNHTYKFHRGASGKREMKYYDDQTIGEAPDRTVDIKGDTVIQISIDSWFDKTPYRPVVFLSKNLIKNSFAIQNLNIWKYNEGSDDSWSNVELNTNQWKNIKPDDINESFFNEQDRLEGWFRTSFVLDSTYENSPINLYVDAWAAIETYIDGELVHRSGNFGGNGTSFEEGRYLHILPKETLLAPGKKHILAIHFVDKLSRLPFNAFKGTIGVEFTKDQYITELQEHFAQEPIFNTITLTTSIILCLLFWHLMILIPREKNLKYIAIFSTLLSLFIIADWIPHHPHTSFNILQTSKLLMAILVPTIFIFSIFLIVKLLNRPVSKPLKSIFLLLVLIPILFFFISTSIIPLIVLIIVIGTCIYYIIISFSSLRGAQWAVIVGVLSTLLIIILTVVYSLMKFDHDFFILSLFKSAFHLAFPFSLLVFTALRFKEIIKEVQINAQKVISLSEEKKERAVQQQKILEQEVAKQTVELRNSLAELKATQSQLIQSEKMASLGELTAGIAHEIQNPLNFVNNFSEVSAEIIDEMNEALAAGKKDEAIEFGADVKENIEKILHHGKRADAIVKGMLQHSRTASGQTESTDINALADEYLRLAYHGIRAKDKSFNAKLETDFDPSIGMIDVVQQDIGRVLLNLLTNAFYAVSSVPKRDLVYEPTVTVMTKLLKSPSGDLGAEISISDNGPGIPKENLDKIFQPFFTTKPTGKGTGLGLSLAYDIVKAHGGELTVKTIEGKGTTFIILLPVS